jgi:hypothetical protein
MKHKLEGRRKKEEGRWKMEDGRWKKEEGRWKKAIKARVSVIKNVLTVLGAAINQTVDASDIIPHNIFRVEHYKK